jgi:hypothetical protein
MLSFYIKLLQPEHYFFSPNAPFETFFLQIETACYNPVDILIPLVLSNTLCASL